MSQPQVTQAKKNNRMRWIIGGIIALFVCGGIASVASPPASNKTPASNNQAAVTQPTDTAAAAAPAAPTNTTEPPTATAAPKANGVGSTAETGGLAITVNGVRHTTKGIVAPKDGMEYVVVDITVANPGTDKKNVSSLLNESLKDGTGQKYTVTIGSDAKASAEGEVAPGDKVRGETTFEIPTTATGLVFVFDPILGGDAVRFNLDK